MSDYLRILDRIAVTKPRNGVKILVSEADTLGRSECSVVSGAAMKTTKTVRKKSKRNLGLTEVCRLYSLEYAKIRSLSEKERKTAYIKAV